MATPTINDYFLKVGSPGSATTLSAPGYTVGSTTINVGSTGSFPTDTAVIFAVDTVSTTTGTQVENTGSYCVFVGIVTSATSIGSVTLLYGTPQNYNAAATTRVYITVSSQHTNRMVTGLLQQHTQTGAHTGITTDTLTATGTVTAANFVQSGGASSNGWNVGLPAPNTVVYNGNRSYTATFNGTDVTGTISPGMRVRTTRTVAAPTQCATLNGTTQYFSKASPAGMTFTDDFVVSAWVKLSSYPASAGSVISRFNGTSGWDFYINNIGQMVFIAFNGSGNNYSYIASRQSIPLNKWVHVAAQLDMSTFTATPTTSYCMIDGMDVPSTIQNGGTFPTTLIQAGNLEIGSRSGGLQILGGKIAQVAVFGTKVTQATMQGYYSQGLTGTETSLISAYSLSGATGVNDLVTGTANNLTANNGVLTTTADSSFGGQAGGSISSTLDYGIVQSATFSTNSTVVIQVPEGCTIPTSGGVSSIVYSQLKAPYGMPVQRGKWRVETIKRAQENISTGAGTTFVGSNHTITAPVGSWASSHAGEYAQNNSTSGNFDFRFRMNGATAGAIDDSQTASYLYSTGSDFATQHYKDFSLELTTQEVYTLQAACAAGAGTTTARIVGSNVPAIIRLENAYL